MPSTTTLFIVDLVATLAPFLLVVLSLNLEYGYGGIPNFGKALSVAAGAFVVGYLPGRLAAHILGIGQGLDYLKNNIAIVTGINKVLQENALLSVLILALTLIVAMAVGAAMGFLVSYVVLRRRLDFAYLAMVLLAAAEVFVIIGYNYEEIAYGSRGVSVPDPFAWAGMNRFPAITLFMVIVAMAVLAYLHFLTNSPFGRVLKAIRDNEYAASASGKDVVGIRLKTMTLSSAIAALAGALYSFYTLSVIATAYDRVTWTFWPFLMVILGGAANNAGVLLGTFVCLTGRKLIIFYKEVLAPFVPFDVVWLDWLLLGSFLLLILLYRPQGLIPEKPVKTIDLTKSALKKRGEKA
jgi:branched-chain amino acid transport system permease protein